MRADRWTPEEDETLRKLTVAHKTAKGYNWKAIVKGLHEHGHPERSVQALNHRLRLARTLNLTRSNLLRLKMKRNQRSTSRGPSKVITNNEEDELPSTKDGTPEFALVIDEEATSAKEGATGFDKEKEVEVLIEKVEEKVVASTPEASTSTSGSSDATKLKAFELLTEQFSALTKVSAVMFGSSAFSDIKK